MCVLMLGCTHRFMCVGQRLIMNIYFSWSLHYFIMMTMIIGRFSHWAWSLLIWLNWLATQPQESSGLPASAVIGTCFCTQFVYVDDGGLNSSPYACKASTLPLRELSIPALFFNILQCCWLFFSLYSFGGLPTQLPNKYTQSYFYLWMPGLFLGSFS